MYVLSDTQATFEGKLIKKLSNAETEYKQGAAH